MQKVKIGLLLLGEGLKTIHSPTLTSSGIVLNQSPFGKLFKLMYLKTLFTLI